MAGFRTMLPGAWATDDCVPILPSGPGGGGDGDGDGDCACTYTAQADSALVPGNAVYTTAASTIDLAQADALPQARLWGLVTVGAAPGFSATVLTQGLMSLTTGQWDAVTGQAGGLTTGSTYWLDPVNPGQIITPAPAGAGYCTFVGKATSSVEIDLDPRGPIRKG